MSLSRFFAATLPTGISVIITTIYLIATGQKFFNQKDSISTNGYKLCKNTQTLFIGVGSSFFLPPSFNEDLTFSVWDVILYGILIDLFWYCSHRTFHQNKWLYKNVHKLHHQSVATRPVDAYIMSAAEVITLTVCISAPSYILNVSQSSILVVTTWYASVGLLEHGAIKSYRFHEIHHLHQNHNYGFFLPIFDYIGGTYRPHSYNNIE
jgi:sterol desaturase/sphingolipid hydroxylase (fatty acid hydroxylase superfamily)